MFTNNSFLRPQFFFATQEAATGSKAAAAPRKKAEAKAAASTAAKPTAKQVKVTSRGHQYEFTAKGKAKLVVADLGGQARVIIEQFRKTKSASLGETAEKVAKLLKTKSDPRNIVAFYFGQWKKDGLIRFVK